MSLIRLLLVSSAICYGLVVMFGKNWTLAVTGHASGNRMRFVSVMKIELILVWLNCLVYNFMMSYFTLEEKEARNRKYTINVLQRRCRWALLGLILASHLMYFMYYAPIWLQTLLFDATTVGMGLWTNMLAFVCGFSLVNLFIGPAMWFPPTRCVLQLLSRVALFRELLHQKRQQVRFTLFMAIALSLPMWYASDKVVVRHLDVPVKGLSAEGGQLRLAVLSDIHAGASVYREQVSRVVDAVLPLSVAGVVIVGDMVDAPVADIEKRVEPMWVVAQRFRTLFVTGNHEYYYGDVREWLQLYEKKGIRVLQNGHEMLKGVCIAGANDISSGKSGLPSHRMNISTALSGCPAKATKVLLEHNPAAVREMTDEDMRKVALMLSGHTHAGQFYVMLPVLYWMLPYIYGLYDLPVGDGKLMVTAGTLYQGPPMKMLAMSQVWVVTLRAA